MVYRIYVEKKPGFDGEAQSLRNELVSLLGIKELNGLRLLNRYDVEGIDEALFEQCVPTVFSEPPVDNTYAELPVSDGVSFAVEYLPGQFDQRADSAAECIQLISQGDRPLVRSARVYLLEGTLTDEQVAEIKKYVINPVEAREASLDTKATLKMEHPVPTEVEVLDGFNELDEAGLKKFIDEKGLAMDLGDIKFCQEYFRSEKRDPTITEIKMIDTYWSDHCRHTTFGTILDDVQIDDAVVQEAFDRYMAMRADLGRENKPRCMMDLATIGAKELKKQGILKNLDESEEINACTVKIKCDVNGKDEDWLFLFKNETHNHPTEIEPFGGAATCIGGAIRDPLSGRSYVYQAMRVTGAGDPLKPVSETLPGKLPQRKLVTTAAAGYSSYGNQIGLATGQVDEIYHPGYVAKRMEIGAVVGATPASHVRRECPAPGDVIVLLGGRTGRDGIGGATGSSKAHKLDSLEHCGAEVQKGNAPIERKLQRLFRREDACKMIKRCNDFGAGGVSVAIGELADGLYIDLNKVTKKYDGLDGTELAISESQERMAVALAPEDVDKFIAIATEENLEATPVAKVTEEKRLNMVWNGKSIVNISREFLNSNGAEKHQNVHIEKGTVWQPQWAGVTFEQKMKNMVGDLNVCSKKGLLLQNLCAFYEVGDHNIIRLRGADWNDALDMAEEKGESVAFTCAYAGNLRQLADYLKALEKQCGCTEIEILEEMQMLLSDEDTLYTDIQAKQELLKTYTKKCRHNVSGRTVAVAIDELTESLYSKADWMTEYIRQKEWVNDGADHAWFNSYYDNHGNRVEGKYDNNVRMMLTGQVFAIMSGTADEKQVQAVCESADTYLYDKDAGGYRLNTNFHENKFDLGRMFGFAYGEKENGAVFSHMTVMYANALYQRGFIREGYKALQTLADTALDFDTSRIYPGIPEYFNAEGRGMYAYLTGAASWYMLTIITEVFGVKGSFGDLVIEPKLVKEQFDDDGNAGVHLEFAGNTFVIRYHNAEKKDYGAYQISEVAAMPELDIRMEGKKAVISKTSIEKSNGGCYTVNVILK